MADELQNPLELSDEDFAKLAMPGVEAPAAEAEAVEAPVQTGAEPVVEDKPTAEGEAGADGAKIEGQEDQGGADAAGASVAEGGDAAPKVEGEPAKEGAEAKPAEGAVPPVGSKPEGQQAEAAVIRTPDTDKAFFDKVMAPFQANGKTFTPQSPEEVIQLMQQGANYTRKMQAIAPHRKMLTMLQNNGLLDEDKLAFLIDLEKGNPEAVQKLLKDKNVDVLSIDTESEPTYRAGNHKVSDAEVAFRTNLEELNSTPDGQGTLQTINSTWDDASKEVLWGEPALMPVIHSQKQNGIYDRIVSEMDRRKMLGQITPETPFIHAYKSVGDDLMKSGGFNDIIPAPAAQAPKPEPVATTAAAPKPVVDNGDKASAASPTRSTPKPAKAFVNPLAMSDAEFEANFMKMSGRV